MARFALPLLFVVGIAAGCARTEAAPAPEMAVAQAAEAVPSGPLPRLVFFINPHGRPCQIQDGILRDMAEELRGKAQLVYYRTTDPADQVRFAQYGIRALPALLLTDADGRELRRTPPGIQGPAQVRQLVAR